MVRLQTFDKYATAEIREIIDRLNRLLEIEAGTITQGSTKKVQGSTYECTRTADDVIVLRYYGDNISLTKEIAMLIELAGYCMPSAVTSGGLTFLAMMKD